MTSETQLKQRSVAAVRVQKGPRIIYALAFLDLFAVSMLTPLLRKQTLEMGSSYTAAGIIGSVYGTAQLFSSPFIGECSDRFGRTRTIFITTILASLGYFVLSFSFWMPILFFGRILCGCFKHTQTLCKAYLADIDDIINPTDHNRSKQSHARENKNFGNFMTFSTLGFVVGPIVGGHIAETVNGFHTVATIVFGILVSNAILAHFFLPEVPKKIRKISQNVEKKNEKAAVWRTLRENGDIFLLQLFVSLSVHIVRTNYVEYMKEHFGVSIKWAGYITSYQALIGVIGSACVSNSFIMSFYEKKSRLMLHSTVLIGAAITGIAWAPKLMTYMFSITILNFVTPFSRLANIRHLTERSEGSEHHGLLMGTSQSVGSLARLSSSFLGGIVQDYSSIGPEMISIAFISISVFQILLFLS